MRGVSATTPLRAPRTTPGRLFLLSTLLGVLATTALLPACPVTPIPQETPALSLQIGTRQSCGLFSGLDYDTACLYAVYIAAREVPSRQIVFERCVTLEDRRAQLGQILRGAPIFEGGGLSGDRVVTFELRGLHDVDVDDPCADAADVNQWLFWGESDAVDLTALPPAGVLVPVVVDCRDCAFDCPGGDCFGCQGLGVGTCSVAVPESFCVPGVSFVCGKRCESDNDCFEGARRCTEAKTCDTLETTGELCSPCFLGEAGAVGCAEGFACVGPPGASQGFCAESCPDTFCPTGTRCNRVGNNLIVIGAG